ncbi:MAG: phosphoribosyltransferase domain-containing protein [Desulfamplus sp.]|nr:phosphoribosyltransferase domain-containing protein [Desulfamplus sp.]
MPKDFYHLKRENNPLREDAFTLACLGKIHPASSADFLRCKGYLSALIQDLRINQDTMQEQVLIIGLTESGIIPALLMYIETLERNLDTSILYSTRRPLSGIAFKESHSHGPDHILPLPLLSPSLATYINTNIDTKSSSKISKLYNSSIRREPSPFKEIWIVEDEITSGNTVYNLMVQLSEHLEISRVRVFAFADFRNSEQKSDFYLKTAQHKIECTVHTLNVMSENPNPASLGYNVNEKPNSTLLGSNVSDNFTGHNKYNSQISTFNGWHLPSKRPALAIKSGDFICSDLWRLPFDKISSEWRKSEELPKRTILAVGEAIDLAACLALSNDKIRFQQISLSPWQVDNRSIFSKISFAERYYLYNYENLKNRDLNPVFILCDPIDKDIEQEAVVKLGEHGIEVKPIFN